MRVRDVGASVHVYMFAHVYMVCNMFRCVNACFVCVCVRACVRVCVCVCACWVNMHSGLCV